MKKEYNYKYTIAEDPLNLINKTPRGYDCDRGISVVVV